MKKIFTVKQAAEYLGVHPQTLRNWDRDGILKPAFRMSKNQQRRYTKEQLDEFLRGGNEKKGGKSGAPPHS